MDGGIVILRHRCVDPLAAEGPAFHGAFQHSSGRIPKVRPPSYTVIRDHLESWTQGASDSNEKVIKL